MSDCLSDKSLFNNVNSVGSISVSGLLSPSPLYLKNIQKIIYFINYLKILIIIINVKNFPNPTTFYW